MARIVELILTKRIAGSGSAGDPTRSVDQLWTKDGQLVAEHDNWAGGNGSWFNPHFLEGE